MKIVILTGAGASVQFENPTTQQFKEYLASMSQSVALTKSLLSYEKYTDIEYILEFLRDIRKIHLLHAAEFLRDQEWRPESINPPFPIREIFSQYVGIERQILFELFKKYKIDSSYDSLIQKFYGGLFEIVKEHSRIITIATTNYDLAIERFCELEPTKFTLCDGFKVAGERFLWAKHLFDQSITNSTDTPIELLKIHGSLNWYDYGGGIEKKSEIEFIPTNEGHQNAFVEPILSPKELEGKEPFDVLLTRFTKALSEADVCIVIGSSFRDGIIKDNLLNFIETGKHLIIVSPSCYQNYASGLRNYSKSDVVSWAKQRALQENGTISWIPISITKDNTDEVLEEIKKKLIR